MPRTEARTLTFGTRTGLAARLWLALTGALSDARARRRDRRQLAQLDNHLLRDIGLTSDQAQAESVKPFWQP